MRLENILSPKTRLVNVRQSNSSDANEQRKDRKDECERHQDLGRHGMTPQLGNEVEEKSEADDDGHDGDADEDDEAAADDAEASVAVLERFPAGCRRMPRTAAR